MKNPSLLWKPLWKTNKQIKGSPMTSVIQQLEKSGGDWLTDDQRVGENQTGHRSLHTRQSLSEAQDFRYQCHQPKRKAKFLTWGKTAFGAARMLVASNIHMHQKPSRQVWLQMFPSCCSILNQSFLFPFGSWNIPREHGSSQTKIEHEYECHSFKTWDLEVPAKCLDKTMSQRCKS